MTIVSDRPALCLLALTVLAGPATAAELAVLRTGYTLVAERHETIGDRVRLYSASGGVTELPARAILRFEKLATVAAEPAPAPEPPPAPERSIDEIVEALAAEIGLHPDLVHSVIQTESAYDPEAVSHKGAIGLMQLMPETARELAVDPWRPEENLAGGSRYLRELLERYEGRDDQVIRAIAAYNAGPAAVDRHDGVPPYAETQWFVRRVLDRFLARARAAD